LPEIYPKPSPLTFQTHQDNNRKNVVRHYVTYGANQRRRSNKHL